MAKEKVDVLDISEAIEENLLQPSLSRDSDKDPSFLDVLDRSGNYKSDFQKESLLQEDLDLDTKKDKKKASSGVVYKADGYLNKFKVVLQVYTSKNNVWNKQISIGIIA